MKVVFMLFKNTPLWSKCSEFISLNNKINIGDKQNQKLAYFDAIKTYEKIVNKIH